MEFMRGGELQRHLRLARHKRFSEDPTRFYAIQIAIALGHLHERQIVYRDFTPSNILLGEDGYICLTDFSTSKILE